MRVPTLAAALLAATALGGVQPALAAPQRPNILIIVADDMAYSDIGAFGGEIDTPNLNALAKSGARLTNFHVSPTCSPTRAMLLTGVDHHPAGLGNMAELLTPEQKGKPGYEGHLNGNVATLAEDLQPAGYRTILSGKWHLGVAKGDWPADRGFERSYVLLQGGENHFGVADGFHHVQHAEDHAYIERRPQYSSDYYTDNLLTLLREGGSDKRPFFAYLAFHAPHWPLQAPEALIAKYHGRYDAGYETLRADRLARQKALGLLGDVPAHPILGAKPWAQLTVAERQRESRNMEVYAAMIDSIDSNVGRVVRHLKQTGQYDNTIIVFLSDNGAAGSAYDTLGTFDKTFGDWIAKNFDNSLKNIGHANSMTWYGPGWGQAGTAPSLLFKIFTSEGGLRSPLIVEGPGVQPGLISTALTHVTDIVPTLLEAAGAAPLTSNHGHPVHAPDGVSLTPVLSGRSQAVRTADQPLGEELFGGRSLIKGDYKALYLTELAANVDPVLVPGRWQLFNIKADPAEAFDLAAAEPARLRELIGDWEAYSARNGVILPTSKAAVGAIKPGSDPNAGQ